MNFAPSLKARSEASFGDFTRLESEMKNYYSSLAVNIIHSLDTIARDHDGYDYGLPVTNEEQMDKMKNAVESILKGNDG